MAFTIVTNFINRFPLIVKRPNLMVGLEGSLLPTQWTKARLSVLIQAHKLDAQNLVLWRDLTILCHRDICIKLLVLNSFSKC